MTRSDLEERLFYSKIAKASVSIMPCPTCGSDAIDPMIRRDQNNKVQWICRSCGKSWFEN